MLGVEEIFNLKCVLIEFVIPNLSQIYLIFCNIRNFLNKPLTPVLTTRSPLNLCFRVVNSQRLFCSKKLVWKVCLKAFRYITNIFIISFLIFSDNPPIIKAKSDYAPSAPLGRTHTTLVGEVKGDPAPHPNRESAPQLIPKQDSQVIFLKNFLWMLIFW